MLKQKSIFHKKSYHHVRSYQEKYYKVKKAVFQIHLCFHFCHKQGSNLNIDFLKDLSTNRCYYLKKLDFVL